MIKIIQEDYLTEMTTIYKSREYGIGVAVHPDSKRTGLSYFKFYDNPNYTQAKKIIRILFKSPDYTVHSDGKKLWKINSDEKKLLIKILKSESSRYDGYTNWDIAKYDWNCEYFEEQFNMKRYFNGEYDEEYKDKPSYVPSYLAMPDYKKITF